VVGKEKNRRERVMNLLRPEEWLVKGGWWLVAGEG
jgi:hypothetical protein